RALRALLSFPTRRSSDLGGRISQSYLSQIENGARLHLTSGTRQTLARFFKVHPGYLLDDLEEHHHLHVRPRRDVDEKLDLWLIEDRKSTRLNSSHRTISY